MNGVPVFNPLNEDVVVKWDTSGKNPLEFNLVSKEVTYIQDEYKDHVKKALADRMFDVLGDYRKDRDMQMKDIYKQMEIK